MAEVNLLRGLPSTKRNIQKRSDGKDPEVVRVSKQFGEMYFDGPREYGYGGYIYDGRWKPVAKDIIDHFGLKPGDKVLDVGCAKGFLVKDLLAEGIDAYGVDISEYALQNCEPEVVGRLHLGSADSLPFPDNSFDCVLSLNTIHNLTRDKAIVAIQEVERLAPGKGFVQVDSYLTQEQKDLFEMWVLTAVFHDYPDEWMRVFKEASYSGDWYWTIVD